MINNYQIRYKNVKEIQNFHSEYSLNINLIEIIIE